VEHDLRPVGREERLTVQDERLEEIFLKRRILEGVPVTSVAGDVASGFLEQGLLRRRNGQSCADGARHAAAERPRPRTRQRVVGSR
jgi:hypothetical protein